MPYEISRPMDAMEATAESTVTEPREGSVKTKENAEQSITALRGDMDFSWILLK